MFQPYDKYRRVLMTNVSNQKVYMFHGINCNYENYKFSCILVVANVHFYHTFQTSQCKTRQQ